jgi:hypothetical protein
VPQSNVTNKQIQSITLPNGEISLFLINSNEILKLEHFKNEKNSLFIGDYITSATLYFTTPFDILFLFIPLLGLKYEKVSDLLYEKQLDFLNLDSLDLSPICDFIEDPDDQSELLFRLNDKKVIGWIKKKIDLILSKFDELDIVKHVVTRIQFTIGLFKELLHEKWIQLLLAEYNVNEETRYFNDPINNSIIKPIKDSITKPIKDSKKRSITVSRNKKITEFFKKVKK